MNKTQMVDHVASKTGLTKKAVADVLEAFMGAVMDAVKKGDSVTFTGFGTFKPSKRQARTGRNPQTGETIQIPAKTVCKFRVAKAVKDAVL